MARQEIIISLKLQDKSFSKDMDKANDVSSEFVKIQKQIEKESSDTGKALAMQREQLRLLKVANQQAAQSALGLAKASKQTRTNVGLNNAIMMEAGRTASDLRYGFTAVANNLGQLADLFRQSANAAGGYRKAIMAAINVQSLVLVGVQLLIAYGDQIYNFFMGASEAANEYKKALEDVNKEALGSEERLFGYVKVLKDANASESARLNAFQELEDVIPNVTSAQDAQKMSTQDLTDSVIHYVEQQRLRAELDALIDANEDVFAENARIRAVQERLDEAKSLEEKKKIFREEQSLITDLFDISEETLKAAGGKGALARVLGFDEDTDYAEVFRSQSKSAITEYDSTIAKIIEIEEKLDPENKKKRGRGRGRGQLVFSIVPLDLSQVELKFRKQANEIVEITEQERLNAQEKFALQDIDRRKARYLERQKVRLDAHIQRLKDRKASNAQIAKAMKEFHDKEKMAEKEASDAKLAVTDAYITKRILLADKEARAVQKILRDTENAEINRLKSRTDLDTMFFDKKREQIQGDIELNNGRLMNEKLTELERQQIAKETFDLQEKLRQNDLQQELAVTKAKKSIQSEYMSWTAGVGTFLKTIAGENEELAKAGIALEKGAAIADVIIKANASKATNIAQATAVAPPPANAPFIIAAQAQNRMTDVSSAIAIANILATSLFGGKKSVGGGGRGGSGSVRVEAPDFNVVGASPEDRLGRVVREELGGQQQQTVRAVVSLNDLDIAQSTRENINRNNSLD